MGEENRIHISETTKDVLDKLGGFRCEYRAVLDLGVCLDIFCHKSLILNIMRHLWSNYVFMQSFIFICRPDNVTWRPFGCLEGKKMWMTSQSEQKVYLEKSLSQGIQLESQPKNNIFKEMT